MSIDEETYDKRLKEHYEKAQEYIEVVASARTTFHHMSQAYDQAVQALIKSGAVVVGQNGNIQAGWYKFDPKQFSTADSKGGPGIGGGATSIGATLGAPVAAWTLVGTFGTASTGAAIGGLSGAAATSATAAWFGGGSVAAGGLGMAFAPIALTGIGAIAGLVTLGTFFTIGHIRNRRNQEDEMDKHVRIVDEAEKRMKANKEWLLKRQDEATEIMNELIKASAILNFISNKCNARQSDQYVTNTYIFMGKAQNLVQKVPRDIPFKRVYLEAPGEVTSIKSVQSGQRSLHIEWDDPDNGESEIIRYSVSYNKDGRFRDGGVKRKVVLDTEIKLEQLDPRSGYEYTITARNPIGWGEVSEEFKARTT